MMSPRAFVLFAMSVSSLSSTVAAVGHVGNGGRCQSDLDCAGGMDCIRTGFTRKNCFAISCAKGAANALLDSGFNADAYLATIRGKTGLRGPRGVTDKDNHALSDTMRLNPPPMSVFESNYTACLNPQGEEGERRLQSNTETGYGLMWALAPLFTYFGKSAWYDSSFGGSSQVSLARAHMRSKDP